MNPSVGDGHSKLEVASPKVEVPNAKVEVRTSRLGALNPMDSQKTTFFSDFSSRPVTASTILNRGLASPVSRRASRRHCRAFSLVEVLIVISLLSLIVLALMDVFSSTQRAFRASVTQSDVLEGSRAAVDLITADLRRMTPSGGGYGIATGDVNFFSFSNAYAYTPLSQKLPGSTVNRTNLLNYFFILGRENTKWIGTGYIVDTTSSSPLYPLYRYHGELNTAFAPRILFTNFLAQINNAAWTNMSHVMDGVVHLVVRPFDPSGNWLTNGYKLGMKPPVNALFEAPFGGEMSFYFFSNAVPAAVELQLGVIEDRALARAESLPSSPTDRRTPYLSGQAGAVHLFRQQVNIPNVDRSAYP